jgi:acyl-CoA synthetase (AMP-forming)/AMP-acid ligase II
MARGLWRIFDRVATERGAAPAILHGDRDISFDGLRFLSARRAAQMVKLGVQPGDRCLLWGENSIELAGSILATWLAGGIVTLVNDEAPLAHLGHAALLTRPKLAIVAQSLLERAAGALDCPTLALELCETSPLEQDRLSSTHDFEPASIFFTSGSTGLPKGVTQNHATLAAGCRMVARNLRLTNEDRILCPIPWAFDYGYGQFLSTVLLGVTHVLPTERNPFALCDALAKHKSTILAGLPSIFGLLLRGLSPLRETDLSSLRLVTNTGGAIAPPIFDEMLEAFAHCAVSLNYGMTETYRSAGLPAEFAAAMPRSVGFAYPGVTISILRESGEEAEPDEVGEIVHRGVGAFMGYWGAPDATASVLRPDPLWRHSEIDAPKVVFTGDLGWKNADGFLMIKGRKDHLIKSMGVRVSPDEIAALIRKSGLVHDVVVLGVPQEILGEMVVAAVIPARAGENPTSRLKAFARREMSRYMQPRDYRVLAEFPLTANGKTDLMRLRTLFLAGETASPAPA